MTASVTPIRPRKPNRRPGALPASPSLEDLARGAALRVELEEICARRGLPSDVPSAMRAMEALSGVALSGHTGEGSRLILEASGS